jgi:hypothetical protein
MYIILRISEPVHDKRHRDKLPCKFKDAFSTKVLQVGIPRRTKIKVLTDLGPTRNHCIRGLVIAEQFAIINTRER